MVLTKGDNKKSFFDHFSTIFEPKFGKNGQKSTKKGQNFVKTVKITFDGGDIGHINELIIKFQWYDCIEGG